MIDKWLIADQDVHRTQRHTARRVWQRLVAEHGATLSEVTVSRYVARRRVELDLVHTEVFIPQTHEPGAEAEVDFGEFYITIAGALVKVWMFVMRLSHCGGRSTSRSAPRRRRHSWRATSWPFSILVVSLDGSGMTTSGPRSPGSSKGATGTRPNGSWRCGRTTR